MCGITAVISKGDGEMRHQTNKWIRRSPVDAASLERSLERFAQLLSEKAEIPLAQARRQVRAHSISAQRGVVGANQNLTMENDHEQRSA
jgi:hypothetical protein